MALRTLVAVGLAAVLVLVALAGAPSATGTAGPVAGPASGAAASGGFGAASASAPVEIAPGLGTSGGIRELGPANASLPMDVLVGLQSRDAAGLTAFVAALYSPGSGSYRAYLDPSALAGLYGASPSSISSALAYFQSYGLSARVSPDHLVIDVDGTTAQMGAAFGTSFEEFQDASGRSFVSHLTPAVLPAGLPWSGALGLGNDSSISPDEAAAPEPTAIAGPAASCSGSDDYVPCQIWTAYDLADDEANGTNGAGVRIGIVDAYDGAEPQDQLAADLGSFDDEVDLPSTTVHYLYPVATTGNINSSNTGWGTEEALDLEWAHAIAPGATIDMTFSPNSGAGLYEAVDYLVAHDLVNVISLSWGEPDVGVYNAYAGPCSAACNASTDGSYDVLSPLLEFAAAEGISVFAATGDCGASDGTSGVSTNYPASDPYVTGVGGTSLTLASSGVWQSESGWSGNSTGARSPGCENQGGSGGGYSPFPRPSWQSGTGLDAGTTRADPDVSAVSAPGVEIVYDNGIYGVAGTSVATPIWAGIAAMADQEHGAALGFLDPSLYAILRSASYATDFHDIQTGNNGYAATVGWDPVTGIGTPNAGGALIADLAAAPVSPSSLAISLNATRTAGTAPLSVTFFANATGGSGTYPIVGVDFGDGTDSAVAAGRVTHVYTTPGVYPAQAYVFDSSDNDSDSIPVAIVVGGGSTLSVTLTASNDAPAPATTINLTANATGGVAPYSYDFWFGDGTFLNDSASAVAYHAYPAAGGYCAVVIVLDAAAPADGGESAPVAISVGGAPEPSCSLDRGTFTLTAAQDVPVRDAPADFPDLFALSGGTGAFSTRVESTDPYTAACGCTILRSAGAFEVQMYVYPQGGGYLTAETNVTVAPALDATYSLSATSGPAPLTVTATADVSGGYGANATSWRLGDGTVDTGTTIRATYAVPGQYWLVADTTDRGDGNASEAFLIDVTASTAGPFLALSIAPAVNLSSGTTVRFAAALPDAAGPFVFNWTLAGGGSAYRANFSRTYLAPVNGTGTTILSGTLFASASGSAEAASATFDLGSPYASEADGFVPAADALVLGDATGPSIGAPPLAWSGNATATGPGGTSLAWSFGNGANATGAPVATSFPSVGMYTVTVEATDGFGDVAWDAHGVDVTAAPLTVVSRASPISGTAPLTVAFGANASGGRPPFAYLWEFGDGTNASVGNTSHTFGSAGNYSVVLTVEDGIGESYHRTIWVLVSSPGAHSGLPLLDLVIVLAVVAIAIAVVVAVLARRSRGPPPVAPWRGAPPANP